MEAYEEYLQRIPALKSRRIPMAIDEWAYTGAGNSLKGTLANAMVLHEMFRHTGVIRMAGHTMGMSSIDYNDTEAAFNTTGLFFKLYRDHFGSVPVEVGGNSPPPPPLYPVGADQPKVNAGSPTHPVDVVAALSSDAKLLTMAVISGNNATTLLHILAGGSATEEITACDLLPVCVFGRCRRARNPPDRERLRADYDSNLLFDGPARPGVAPDSGNAITVP